ncbi:MAG: 2-amino-4-hydroxy-6-hydroxymethyldihydropteridine diphosphokinase [Methyloceanibacter sp.]|uniref:2-amino-4-hydroxy-6- hydroxymethyldihydropteridine diphosphokinase n=1 Tax=Methyloceanibacter sp. TaxID=1965321 RepID=UPI003D6D56C0
MATCGKTLVSFGANYPGPWGSPADTIARAVREIAHAGIAIEAVSGLYETAAVGRASQPSYINAVALIDTPLSPEALLRALKGIERRAGRRGGSPWGPRTLDIDILDHKGLVKHWRGRHPRFARAGPRPLVLPHPWMHERLFVLRPLLDIAPDWRHPVLKRSTRELWREAATAAQGQVLRKL